MSAPTTALALTAVAFGCVVTPVVGMAMLMPALSNGRLLVENYRGAKVSPGLGIVWVWWVAGLLVVAAVIAATAEMTGADPRLLDEPFESVLGTLFVAAVVVIPAFVFGMIDDVFGSAEDKGFKGHVRALLSGRLTTGMLKLVGIGFAALMVSAQLTSSLDESRPVLGIVVRTLVIALWANAANLLDLRPGRTLKMYAADATLLIATVPLVWSSGAGSPWLASLLLALALVGPLLAVWRYDLREAGMLGDAGANPAGALLGVVACALWPLWALSAVALLLLGLNVLSERVSLSEMIESSPVLSRLDALGRIAGEPGSGIS